MTGKDVKRRALRELHGASEMCDLDGLQTAASQLHRAHHALAPCVVLTPEEREKVWAWCARWATPHDDEGRREVLALLTPDEAGDE